MITDRSVFLRHALDCIDFVIGELVATDRQQFEDNRVLRDAVLRNQLAHEYLGLDIKLVWNIVRE